MERVCECWIRKSLPNELCGLGENSQSPIIMKRDLVSAVLTAFVVTSFSRFIISILRNSPVKAALRSTGTVQRFKALGTKVPQIGWNRLTWTKNVNEQFPELPSDPFVYLFIPTISDWMGVP